jgi:hypothetical protein
VEAREASEERHYFAGAGLTVADSLVLFAGTKVGPYANIAKWFERFVVERGRELNIRNAERQVVKHVHSRSRAYRNNRPVRPNVVLGRERWLAAASRNERARLHSPDGCA